MTQAPDREAPYRPLPPGPSPRWALAAGGARLMAGALLARFALGEAESLLRILALRASFGGGAPSPNGLFTAAGVASAVALVPWALYLVGLWRLGDAPPRANTRGAALAALAVSLASAGCSFGANLLAMWSYGHGGSAASIASAHTASFVVQWALRVAHVALVLAAVGHALRAGGRRLPWWAASLVLGALASGVGTFLTTALLSWRGDGWALVSFAAGFGFSGALALAQASLLRRAAEALAAQHEP